MFYEATVILIPKADKNTIKKENYSSISLMNINENILNKILANQIQQHSKMSHITTNLYSSEVHKNGSIYMNQCDTPTTQAKDKNYMITSINAEKLFDNFQLTFMIKKTFTKVGIEGTYLT